MDRFRYLAPVLAVMMLPSAVYAQGAIAGAVRDSSGGSLPGVTVEAASDALIERVRSAVTDGQGQYRIIDLRPGTYAVTFSLPGFVTVKRDGLTLTAGTTLPVNADLSVGGVQETVVVTSETPVVDVQNTRQQVVVSRDLLDQIPRARGQQSTGQLLPGMNISGSAANDVGGSTGLSATGVLSIHGGDGADQTWAIDGVKVGEGGRGGTRQLIVADATVQEYTFETSGISAEYSSGGVRTNLVPKEGGNRFSATFLANFTGRSMVSNNLSDDIKARGLTTVSGIDKIWDVSPAVGGPIVRDALWFFATYRHSGKDSLPPDAFYESDPTKRAVDIGRYSSANARLTWQASPKHKLSFYYDTQTRHMPYWSVTSTQTPEASIDLSNPALYLVQGRWNYLVNNRILVQTVGTYFQEVQFFGLPSITDRNALPHVEITTGRNSQHTARFGTGCSGYNVDCENPFTTITSNVTYTTGSHALKFGINHVSGCRCAVFNDLPPIIRTNNGVPFQVQFTATPRTSPGRLNHDLGVFVQDQWTFNRFTLNLGARYDWLNQQLDAQSNPAGRYVGPRSWPEVKNVPNWHDFSPRMGMSWDVFGNGKTAVKTSLSRYLYQDQTSFSSNINPLNSSLTTTDTRTVVSTNGSSNPDNWTLGPSTNLNFGRPVLAVSTDPSVSEGWGARPYNWEYAAVVQHELVPALSVSLGYYRRWFGSNTWTNNTLVTPADYTPFDIRNPIDGSPLTLFNLNPAKRGISNNVVEFAPENTKVFDGVDLLFNGRLPGGAMMTGGITTGRTAEKSCTVWDPNQSIGCEIDPGYFSQNQYKVVVSYPLPYDIHVSGAFQSVQGPAIAATYNVTSAIAGVPLTNGTIPVRLLSGEEFDERLNRLDLRLARNFRVSATGRIQPYVDLFNMFNAAPVTSWNTTYGPAWLRPTGILVGRMLQVGVQIDY